MRTNLENNLLYEPRISGARFASVTVVMTGAQIIPNDGPSVWALDGGASDRTVKLPSLTKDKMVVIGNVGGTNAFTVVDSSNNSLTTVPPNSTTIFYASTGRWVWLAQNFLNSITTRVLTGTASVLATDVEVQVNSAGAAVLTLPNSTTWASSVGWTGLPLTIIDISGDASSNPITINPSGGQTLSGQTSLTINKNYGVWQLRPKNGGGWVVLTDDLFNNVAKVSEFGALPNGTDVRAKIQTALNSGYKKVFLDKEGTYGLDGAALVIPQGVEFYGMGKDTILKRLTAGDIINITGTSDKFDISIHDMTLDLDSKTLSNGIFVEWVTNFLVERVWIKNQSVWGIIVGVLSGVDGTIRNRNVQIRDVHIGPAAGAGSTYEGVALLNIEDSVVADSTFTTNPLGIGVGLFQRVENVTVERNTFTGFASAMYYPISGSDIIIQNNKILNSTNGIQGANSSDNGDFGYRMMTGLIIQDNLFSGNTTALNLGGVRSGRITKNKFYSNTANALIVRPSFDFFSAQEMTDGVIITENIFRNNNTGGGSAIFHPGILFHTNSSVFISGAANNGSGLIRLTLSSTGNFASGDTVTVSGVLGTTEANGTWVITVIDATHVDLRKSAFVNAYTSGGSMTGYLSNWNLFGIVANNQFFDDQFVKTQLTPIAFFGATTWFNGRIESNRMSAYGGSSSISLFPSQLVISGAANNGSGGIRLTTASTASLTTGDVRTVADVAGTTEANGVWTITVIDATHFDLNGSAFVNAYVSGGFLLGATWNGTFTQGNNVDYTP